MAGREGSPGAAAAEPRKRLRDLSIAIGHMSTGPLNAITDVAGVRVGHATVNFGEGKLVPGKGPARTGVTIVIPHSGDLWRERVSAGYFVLNGNGGATGLDWIRESGLLEGPIALTNTHSVGDVYSALVQWMMDAHPEIGREDDSYLPVVAECDDGFLNDLRGRHVKEAHVFQALNTASGGPVPEGAVGAGTGMMCYDFKGGIGTSSRRLKAEDGGYIVGALVNCNHGTREQLVVAGVPVGRLISDSMPEHHREGSIVIVVATDAPLSGRQLNRLATRAALGLARTGSVAHHGSGDFTLTFSNGRKVQRTSGQVPARPVELPELPDSCLDPLFEASAEATEEAILNALCTATTTTGRDGNVVHALPLARMLQVMGSYGGALQKLDAGRSRATPTFP